MDILTPRRKLLLYLAVLPAPTLIHQPALLAAGFALALLLAGKTRWRILSRSLIAILAFNLSVSLGVVLVGLWQGRIDVDWLLLANLRVLLMVYLGFWFVAQGDLIAALDGLPTARRLVTLTLGQIRTFERVLSDFRLAFASRNIARPRLLDRRHHAGAQVIALLDKAQAQALDVALAMRSRGTFD